MGCFKFEVGDCEVFVNCDIYGDLGLVLEVDWGCY